ncbi:MAG: SH3 domain-containing protein [Oligoflexia bacterium]|nr:SH3 domain-containing protein [Oligoflexia bacterium]
MSDSEQDARSSGKPNLDLGFSSILAEADGASKGAAAAAGEPLPAAPPASAAQEPPPSELEALAQKSQWSELSRVAETQIAAGDNSVALRLWWVLGQLRMKAVPSSILAAPLDSATRDLGEKRASSKRLESSPQVLKLAAQLLSEVGRNLKEGGDLVMAVVLLERAWKIDGSAKELLSETLDLEIKNLENQVRRNSDETLKQRVARLRSLKSEVGWVFKAKGGATEVAGAASLTSEPVSQDAGGPRWMRRAIIAVAALCLILLGWLGYLYFAAGGTGELKMAAVVQLPKDLDGLNSAALPKLDPLQGLGDLDAVYYQLGQKQRVENKKPTADSGSESQEKVAKAKEIVNTSGPVESEQARTKAVGAARTESRAISDPPPPRREFERREPERRRRLASSRDEPAPVAIEEFEGARYFRVEASTTVMSKPSSFAVPLYDLVPGDRVRAEARVGEWIKLRSMQGRIGYVSSHDLSPDRERR